MLMSIPNRRARASYTNPTQQESHLQPSVHIEGCAVSGNHSPKPHDDQTLGIIVRCRDYASGPVSPDNHG
jgi:hypothetical protein